MRYTGLAYRLPRPLRRHILHFETEIEDAVTAFAASLPPAARLLDAGAEVTLVRDDGYDVLVGEVFGIAGKEFLLG